MRTSLIALPLMFAVSCTHAPKEPLPRTYRLTSALAAQGEHGDLPFAATVRAELRKRAEDATACLEEAQGASAPEPYTSTSRLFVWRGRVQLGQGATHPFALAFERCFAARLADWKPGGSDSDEGVVVRFSLWPADTDPQRTPWPDGRYPAYEEVIGSPLATHRGITVYTELTQFALGGAGSQQLGGKLEMPRKGDVHTHLGKLAALSREQQRKKNEGVLVLKCVITRAGRAENCRVLRPFPGMQEAYLSLMREGSFLPATIQGIPVDYDENFIVRFSQDPE